MWEMNAVFVVNVVFLVVFPVLLVSCWVIYFFIASGNDSGLHRGKQLLFLLKPVDRLAHPRGCQRVD
jgi:hypothetical protein